MKILVTGTSGQLGTALKSILEQRDDIQSFFLSRKQLPLEHTEILQDMLGMYQPDIIIHAAAYTAVDKAESEAALADRINHLACEEIAQYCHLHGARMIGVSTDYVFDGTAIAPQSENAPVNPINVYGKTKLLGEYAIQKWAPQYMIIRTSWVYSLTGSNFVNTMLRLLGERDAISVVDDQIGAPTYAQDLAVAIVHLIEATKWENGIYNYSNQGAISWYDFACAIKEISGAECAITPISTAQYPTAARRPAYAVLDTTKIRARGIAVPHWRDSLALCLAQLNSDTQIR
ncbi:MAG: dTDP-4-dehydrorhamnose reductase [Sphingobacterium sp.]